MQKYLEFLLVLIRTFFSNHFGQTRSIFCDSNLQNLEHVQCRNARIIHLLRRWGTMSEYDYMIFGKTNRRAVDFCSKSQIESYIFDDDLIHSHPYTATAHDFVHSIHVLCLNFKLWRVNAPAGVALRVHKHFMQIIYEQLIAGEGMLTITTMTTMMATMMMIATIK